MSEINKNSIKDNFLTFYKIIVQPYMDWCKFNLEHFTYKKILCPYSLIILVLLFIARTLGLSFKYLQATDLVYILLFAFVRCAVDILFFIIVVNVTNLLLPYYNVEKSRNKTAVVTFISLFPFYFTIILLNIFPSLYFFAIFSLYALYVYYWGIVRYLKINKNDVLIYFIVTLFIAIGLYLILLFIFIRPFFEFIF